MHATLKRQALRRLATVWLAGQVCLAPVPGLAVPAAQRGVNPAPAADVSAETAPLTLQPWERYLGTLVSLGALLGGAALIWGVAMRRTVERRTRELEDQRRTLHTLVSTLPDVIFVKDLKGVYLACNPAFERVVGRPEADIIGRDDDQLTDAEQADSFRQRDLDTLAAGRSLMYEEWLTFGDDGQQVLFETIKTPMRDATGKVVGVLGISRDMTVQRRAEARLRQLNQLYRVLTRVQDTAAQRGDAATLYAAICDAVVEDGGMTLAWVGSTDARRESLRPVHRAGDTLINLPPLPLNASGDRWRPDDARRGAGAMAALRAWREGATALVMEDTGETPRPPGAEPPPATRGDGQRRSHRAWLALPLKVDTEVRAVLCMLAERVDRFDAEEVGLLERLAAQVSLTLSANEAEATRHQVVSALRDSESRFSLMFQTSPVGMVVKAASGRVVDVNQAWLDLFGYRRAELLGADATPPELWLDEHRHPALIQETLDNGAVSGREIRLKRRNGELLDIAYSATRTVLNGQDHLLASFVDITLQKHATRQAEEEADQLEHEVQRRTAELNSIFEALPDRYFRLSSTGVLLDFRAGNNTDLYKPPAELLGQPISAVMPPDVVQAAMAAIAQVNQDGRPVSIEYELQHPSGRVQADEARFVPIGTDGDVVAVVRDVSERRSLEAAREAARQDAERQAQHRSEFLANMSHEIRTPLNGILGFAQLGYEQARGQPTQAGYGRIMEAGQLLLAIINDVLDYSKIEAGRMDVESIPASPRQLIDATAELVREAARQKGLALRVHIAPELPLACMTDPTRLQQILANLLANAVKFTHRGGIDLHAEREGDWLRVRVQDSGIGMSESQIEQLFAPFQQADASTTRRYGGTGLGLAISRQLAELMGGTLAVRSTLDEGSEFTLRLPLRAVPATWRPLAPTPVAQAGHGPQLAGLRLLVAEDNPVNQIVIKQALTGAGAQVTLTSNGREAVEQVIGAPDRFDAVLMDIQMPEMDGYEATRRIRLIAPMLPVIGQTAHALQEERDQCLACGMVAHVAKPIDLGRLVATLRAVVPVRGAPQPATDAAGE